MAWGVECNWCHETDIPLVRSDDWSAMICEACIEIVRAKFKPPEPAKVVDLDDWRDTQAKAAAARGNGPGAA